MMRNLYLFGIIFFSSIVAFSQTTISGSVMIDNTDETLDGKQIIIINQSSKKRVIADKDGLFTIEVNLEDIIEVKSIFTEPRKIKITENILAKRYLRVHLDIETIELNEANLKPLNSILKNNVNTIPTDKEKRINEINYLSTQQKQAMVLEHEDAAVRRTIEAVGGVNLLGIGRAFFKPKIKNVTKKKLNFEIVDEIKAYFTANYFIEELKIQPHQVNTFIGYCMNKTNIRDLFESDKIDEMILVFEEELIGFLKLINPQDSLSFD